MRRYREKLAEARLDSLADLAAVPLTDPEEVAASFPYGLFAFPLREVIRLHSTLGPEGKPLVIGHTRNDLAQWGRLVARQLAASGVTANDVVLICLGGTVHPGASGYILGAELIEASVIAEDALHIDYQLAMLQNYRPTVLITTPSNAFTLIQRLEKRRAGPPVTPFARGAALPSRGPGNPRPDLPRASSPPSSATSASVKSSTRASVWNVRRASCTFMRTNSSRRCARGN